MQELSSLIVSKTRCPLDLYLGEGIVMVTWWLKSVSLLALRKMIGASETMFEIMAFSSRRLFNISFSILIICNKYGTMKIKT